MTLQEQIRANRLRTGVLLLGFALVIVALATLLATVLDVWVGAFALAGALVYALFGVLGSTGMVASMTGAEELPPEQLRSLRRVVENVAIAAGLERTPDVRVVRDSAPNAFATGLTPAKSFVGVTTGLLETMPRRELEAVVAHEIAHVRNRDTRLMTLAVVFAGVIALVADIAFRTMAYGGGRRDGGRGGPIVIVLAVIGFLLAPIAATLLRLALSRRREYLADATAAEILNDPEAMALALRRLELDPTTVRHADASVAHLWIESPTHRVEDAPSGGSALAGLFDTHPPLAARIAALEEAGGFRLPDGLPDEAPFIATLA